MGMCKRKKQLASMLILAMLLVASIETAEGKLVCDIYTPMCIAKCYKTGKCMRCCKYSGFIHGRCSLPHGMGCYCCYDDSDPPAALRRQQQTVTAPPPVDHRLHA